MSEIRPIENYIAAIDAIIIKMTGLSVTDMPDYDFASAFADDLTPDEVAREILEGEGFDFED